MPIGNERGKHIFILAGALVEGHFRLSSGLDGLMYVNKGKIPEPGNEEYFEEFCQAMANDLFGFGLDTLAGPQTGSIPFVTRVAGILTEKHGREIKAVFVEKCPDGSKNFYIKDEDKQHIKDKRCGLLEDVTTTKEDGSLSRVVRVIEEVGGDIVVATVLWNRGRVTKEDLGVRELISQIDIPIDTFQPRTNESDGDCPDCINGVRYHAELGHGKNLPACHPLAPIKQASFGAKV